MRYLYGDARSRKEVEELLAERVTLTSLREDDDSLVLAVERRDDGRVIGDVSLWLRSAEHRQGEIGFAFHPDAQGRGYACEAAMAVLRLAFERLGLHRVFGRTDARNVASAALMRRLGMRQEAHLRENEMFKGAWGDELVFAVLEDEWDTGDRSTLGPMADDAPAPRPPLPPFTEETARQKVQAAEDAWNSRDPERVALAYTLDSQWRNRSEFLTGRDEIRAFLTRKWQRELDYVLRKDLWAFSGNRIAVRFQYEWRDANGQWWRSYGNENWEFDEHGLMRRREASINDVPIAETERRIEGTRPAGDAAAIPLH